MHLSSKDNVPSFEINAWSLGENCGVRKVAATLMIGILPAAPSKMSLGICSILEQASRQNVGLFTIKFKMLVWAWLLAKWLIYKGEKPEV